MIPTHYDVPRTVERMYEELASRLPGFRGLDRTGHYSWTSLAKPAQQERSTPA